MKMTAFLKSVIGGVLLAAMLAACGGGSGGGSSFFGAGTGASATSTGNSSESSPASSSGTSPTTSGSLTLARQIEQLERKGGYPALDRSSDIAGPDANKNGVRDDVEAWINTLSVTEPQRKALMQKAKSLQQTLLVDLTDKAAVRRAGEGLAASTNCAGDRFEPVRSDSYALTDKIEAMTANTRERAARYMQYNKARSGSSTTYPSGDTCEP
jgi:hypothetical protein